MKLLVFLFLIAWPGRILYGQEMNEFAATDLRANHIPAKATATTQLIADYVQLNFKTDRQKLRAIYTWVINNLTYDSDSMLHINWSLDPAEKISATLRRRKGVCENYAALFTDIAQKAGFPSVVVNGYTRVASAGNRAGHSWSAVYLQSQWYLCDPTWDDGQGSQANYFLVPPAQFIKSHMPFDPLWQLLERPITEQEFVGGSSLSRKKDPPLHFADSVAAFLQLDSLRQLEASAGRIIQAGVEKERLRQNWLAFNKMKIAIIYGEMDMNWYNGAVEDLNRANTIFNNFVQYRNNRFMPVKPDVEMNSLLTPITGLLNSALKKLEQMGRGSENFQYDAGALKERLDGLNQRVKEQQKFLQAYLSSSLAGRDKLFYQ